MTINLFQTTEYKTIIHEHIFKTMEYLFQKNQEFAIACEIQHIAFNPELPHSIADTFDDTVLFILSGYTFESATLDQEAVYFEAGFGENNFGSTVSVPFLAIRQLMVDDHPIIFNLAKHTAKKEPTAKNSMESLLMNPENKKLLKKRK